MTATITRSNTSGAQTTSKTAWGNGPARTVTDPAGGVTQFFYDPVGKLTYTVAPGGYSEHLGYDRRGRKTLLECPDAGNWSYTYNGLGELTSRRPGHAGVLRQPGANDRAAGIRRGRGVGQPLRYKLEF